MQRVNVSDAGADEEQPFSATRSRHRSITSLVNFILACKLGGAANKLLLPSPSYATHTLHMQITNTSNLPRMVVMETAEDNVQGNEGV